MNLLPAERESGDEAGLSLIELIVVVVLVGILSGVVVMILVNSWNTQQDVNSTTVATNEGQVYASSIERAVRNALEAAQVHAGEIGGAAVAAIGFGPAAVRIEQIFDGHGQVGGCAAGGCFRQRFRKIRPIRGDEVELGPDKDGAFQVRAGEVAARKVGVLQIGARKFGLAQVGAH